MRIDPLDDLPSGAASGGKRLRETPAGFLRFPNVGQSPLDMPSDIPGSLKWPELDCDARFVERARSLPVPQSTGEQFRSAQENRTRRQSLQEVSTGELICDC